MPPTASGAWPKSPLVYEINTRVWLYELSTRAGRPLTLAQVPPGEIERIAELGFHAVWLMGVWTTGPKAVEIARAHPAVHQECRHVLPDYTPEDCIGSPYAISDYAVAPRLGGPAALEAFRRQLARRGLRLILDFVSNHTACDHPWVAQQPEIFVQGTEADLAQHPDAFFRAPGGAIVAHGRDPYFPPWTDTAQLNYAQPAARKTVLAALQGIAAQCDGVRCDMAMLILPEIFKQTWGARLGPRPLETSFWREAIPRVLSQHRHFLFVAEAYWNLEYRLQQEGFDFTYDKTLYDRLLHDNVEGVRQHLCAELSFQERCARFVENHDEARAAQAFGPARARNAALVSFFTPGFKLFHEGQFEGRRIKLPVHLRRHPAEKDDLESVIFYEKILGALRDPLFQNGTFSQLTAASAGWGNSSNEALVALAWTPAHGDASQRQRGYLIAVNLCGGRAYARIALPPATVSAGAEYILYDHLDGKRYERKGDELLQPGLYIALEAFQTHLFEITVKS